MALVRIPPLFLAFMKRNRSRLSGQFAASFICVALLGFQQLPAFASEDPPLVDTPLTHAIFEGDLKLIEELLDHGAKIEEPDSETETPLIVAAIKGNLPTIELLLKRGAKIDHAAGNGHTPLMAAAYVVDESAIALLLQRGADACLKSKADETALSIAKWNADVNHDRDSLNLLGPWLIAHPC